MQKIVDEAQRIAREQRFFHWELAFPEIFFDADGKPKANRGFDTVVGNLPYVRQERIQPIEPFLQEHRLNAIMYYAFKLTQEERQLIDDTT